MSLQAKILPFLLITLLSGLIYFNSLENPFHFDDSHHIIDNPHIRSLRDVPNLFTDTRTFSVWPGNNRHYRPLLLLTHVINYALGGLNPIGYHLVNLAFHVGSAFLVFLIVQTMLVPPLLSSPHKGGKNKPVAARDVAAGFSLRSTRDVAAGFSLRSTPVFIALTSALIFAVHPFNSEVVNYISARSSVMSGFFYLLAFYCWVRFRNVAAGFSLRDQGGIPRNLKVATTPYYLTSLLAFLLGMLTKEVVITLPIMLWLYDLYFNRSSPGAHGTHGTQAKACGYMPALTCLLNWRTYIPYIPFVLFVAIPYMALRGFLIKRSGHITSVVLARGYYENLLMGPEVLVKYIQLWLIPTGLSIEHTFTYVSSILEWQVLLSIGSIVGFLLLSVWLYRLNHRTWTVVSFFILWYFIVLLPTLVIPLNIALQENRGYLAGVSFAIIVGIVLGKGIGEAADSGEPDVAAGFSLRSKSEVRRYVSIALASILFIILSIMTVHRNRVWQDDLTLWSDAARKSPLSARSHHYLALTYSDIGKTGDAIVEYQKALTFEEGVNKGLIHNNLGSLYARLKLWDLAMYEYKMALEINPHLYKAYNNIGTVYMVKGDLDEAAKNFKEALGIYPDYLMAQMNLKKVYEEKIRLDKK